MGGKELGGWKGGALGRRGATPCSDQRNGLSWRERGDRGAAGQQEAAASHSVQRAAGQDSWGVLRGPSGRSRVGRGPTRTGRKSGNKIPPSPRMDPLNTHQGLEAAVSTAALCVAVARASQPQGA